MEKKRAESSKTRASNLQNYQITNKGILDVDIISELIQIFNVRRVVLNV